MKSPKSMGEFDLIAKYFTRPARLAVLGVGDDCALLAPTPGMQWAVSSDMLVEARHFFANVRPEHLGHKALAVNLSDLAACGAKPLAFTLALALPHIDEDFLTHFSRGLLALADAYQCELIGGDTTQGPLNICITVLGEVPPQQALLRSGAQVGDDIYVSGTLGDARLALNCLRGQVILDAVDLEKIRPALEQPQPRVALGLGLRGVASSAIDLSDGLQGDLTHLLKKSNVGATIFVDALPLSSVLFAQNLAMRRQCTLGGGDDYELLFTASANQAHLVQAAATQAQVRVTRIGRIEAQLDLRLQDAQGDAVTLGVNSFDHFKS
jgi:thiamine-monophosphate kinase